MSRLRCAAALLAVLLASTGCGARSSLELPTDDPSPKDAGTCTPAPCPAGNHWDSTICACIANPCGSDPASDVLLAHVDGDFVEGTAIAVADGTVYWAVSAGKDQTGGSVHSVPRCGGAATTLATNLVFPSSVAVDSANVYWGTTGANSHDLANGGLYRIGRTGGAPIQIDFGPVYGGGVASDGKFVYWVNYHDNVGAWREPILGGTATPTLIGQVANEILVDGARAYLSQVATIPANSKLITVPLGGGTPTAIVPANVALGGVIAMDASNLYYVTMDHELRRIDKNGGNPTKLTNGVPNGLATDGVSVYWVQANADESPIGVRKMPVGGGDVTLLSTRFGTAVAVDDAYVYWLAGPDLYRLPK